MKIAVLPNLSREKAQYHTERLIDCLKNLGLPVRIKKSNSMMILTR